MKKGYKQTEVGVIPEDWEVKTLESCVEKNGIIRGPFGGALKKECFVPTGYKVYEQKNAIYKSSDIGEYYIDKSKFIELLRFQVKAGDFIVSCSGTIGRIFQIPKNHLPGIINQALLILKVDEKVCNLKYFEHYFSSNWFQEKITDSTQGGAMKNMVGMKEFKMELIPLPPTLAEQTAIATALSDMDQLIAGLEQLIAKKKAIKQGAMQELLRPNPDSYREGWVVKRLGDLTKVFTKQTGFDYSAYIKPSLVQIKSDDTIPFIQNKDFNNKWINYNTDYFIPLSVALQFPKILLDEKCLLISISGSIGNIGVYESESLAFIGGAIAILKFQDEKIIDWIMYYLKSNDGQNKLFGSVKSGSHQNLILDDIRKVEVPIPSIEEQIRITNTLSDMDIEIGMLNENLEKYRLLKQGMMQELLTGKTRLV